MHYFPNNNHLGLARFRDVPPQVGPKLAQAPEPKTFTFLAGFGVSGLPGTENGSETINFDDEFVLLGRVRERQFWILGGSQGRSWGLLGESLASPRSAFRGLLGHLGMT